MSLRVHGAVSLALCWLLACAPDHVEPTAEPVSTDHLEAGSPAWTKVSDEATVVAHVGGAPITRQMVLDVQQASPGLDARGALERLVDLEVLAQRAVQLGLDVHERVRQTRQESLVQRFLAAGFEPEVTPESLPLAQVKELYYVPNVRKLYDHADAWRMAHVFFTCCDPKSESCDQPEIVQCFAESGGDIQLVFSELKTLAADAEGDVDALVEIMETYRSHNETRFLRHAFAFRTRAFYYDPKKSHDEQKGYDIIAEVVARTVMEGELAVLQAPIQSPFGWHVIAQLDHVEEDRRTADDPTVIADIRKNMLPRMRQARFRALLGKLAQDHGVEVDATPLDNLNLRFNARL